MISRKILHPCGGCHPGRLAWAFSLAALRLLAWAGRLGNSYPRRGICTPGRPGRVSVESTAKIKKLVHRVGLVGQNCIFPILFLSRASSKRSYSKIEKYPTKPTSENPQNTKKGSCVFLSRKRLTFQRERDILKSIKEVVP